MSSIGPAFHNLNKQYTIYAQMHHQLMVLIQPVFNDLLKIKAKKPWLHQNIKQVSDIWQNWWKIAKHAVDHDAINWRAKTFKENYLKIYWAAIYLYQAYIYFLQVYSRMIADDAGNPERAQTCYHYIMCNLHQMLFLNQPINWLSQYQIPHKIALVGYHLCERKIVPDLPKGIDILAIKLDQIDHRINCHNVDIDRNLSWLAQQVAQVIKTNWTNIQFHLGERRFKLDNKLSLRDQFIKLGSILFFTIVNEDTLAINEKKRIQSTWQKINVLQQNILTRIDKKQKTNHTTNSTSK